MLIQIFQAQLMKMLIQNNLIICKIGKSKLIDLHIAGKLNESDCKMKSEEYTTKEQEIKADIIIDELPKDDFKHCLEYVCSAINNIETLWLNSELDTKQRLQKLIFPKGMTYDLEKF